MDPIVASAPDRPRGPRASGPGWITLGVYALPAVGLTAPAFFVQFYFLNFATDALLLAPATVGTILAAGRFWDALTDPVAGWASDRTRTRWGRRRPWMALAAPAGALAFLGLWSPPAALQAPAALAAWSAVALFLFTAATTAWGIPHQALAVDLSDDADARTGIFGLRFVVSLSGVALSFVGMQWVGNAADPRGLAAALAGPAALAMLALLWVPAFGLRERAGHRGPIASHPFRAAREILSGSDARRLLWIWFSAQLGLTAQGVVAPYMSRYVMERPDLMGVMPALFIAPMVASVPLWVRLARRHGRKRVWRLSMLGASACYALIFLVPYHDFPVIGVVLGAAGFFTGCSGPVGPTFFASLVDADARRTGERREGMVFAAKEFVEKASSGVVALAVGLALQAVDFEPNAPQGEGVKLAIRACLGLLPGGLLLLSALLLRGLALDDPRAEPGARR